MSSDSSAMYIRDVVAGITTLSFPFSIVGLNAGGRSTVVRLSTGSLAVFSPAALTPAVREKLDSLGTVRYIIAPNFEHHLYISTWAEAFPDAAVICVEGLPEKREKSRKTSGVKFAHVFKAANKGDMSISPEFDAEFEYEYADAAQNKDLVFFHKPTRTLIQADLLFNLPATEQYPDSSNSGLFAKASAKIFSTKGDLIWQKRNLWYAVASKNRTGFAESAKRIVAWDFDRIIPCHGDVIETNGRDVFERATEWFLVGKH